MHVYYFCLVKWIQTVAEKKRSTELVQTQLWLAHMNSQTQSHTVKTHTLSESHSQECVMAEGDDRKGKYNKSEKKNGTKRNMKVVLLMYTVIDICLHQLASSVRV